MINVITNNQFREYIYASDVPESVIKDQFDWMESPDEWTFIKYKGYYYTFDDFMPIDKNNEELKDWDGASSDSFFSGVLIKLDETGQGCLMGHYYS